MSIYCINVPDLFELVGTKRKTKERKNKTKHQRWESGVDPGVCDAVRRSHTLVCLCDTWNAWTFIKDKRHVHTELHRLSKQLLTEQMPWSHTQLSRFSSDVPLLYRSVSVYIILCVYKRSLNYKSGLPIVIIAMNYYLRCFIKESCSAFTTGLFTFQSKKSKRLPVASWRNPVEMIKDVPLRGSWENIYIRFSKYS